MKDNELIARFMEVPSKEQGNFTEYIFPDMDGPEDVDYSKWYYHNGRRWESTLSYDDSELKYHSSWDWLMPVVRKCSSLNWEMFTKDKEVLENRSALFYNNDIVGVYEMVVEFIKWYNSLSK